MTKKNIGDWILSSTAFEPPIRIGNEFFYYLVRWSLDILIIIPFLCFVLMGLVVKLFRKKRDKKQMFFGSHPIVMHMQNKKVLESKYDCTLFAFDDWSNGGMHDGITLHAIMPSLLIGNRPYLFGSYWAMIWVLYRFDMVHLYFDGGLLERTIWWRLEPWLYQLYNIKTVMYPYGSDVMTIANNNNRLQRWGHMQFRKQYFMMDHKRDIRNRWWCKYANLVIGYAPYIDFLPRLDILIWHGHILDEITYIPFPDTAERIKILHYASHGVRKSSAFICEQLSRLAQKYTNVQVECLSGLSRESALKKLEEAHIFIDSLNDGYIQFSSLEAMLKGKVVLSALDAQLEEFFRQIAPDRYEIFFNELPLIPITHSNLFERLEHLVQCPEELSKIGEKNCLFANKLIEENKASYREIISILAEQ